VLRLYAFIALVAIALVVIAGALAYRYIALTTPPAPDLSQLVAASPGISRTYAADGTKLDEFALEWRHPVPYDQIPPRLIDAVIAIEDHEFFEHRGIYWKGIVRARPGATSSPATSSRAAARSPSRSPSSSSAPTSRCRARPTRRCWRCASSAATPRRRSSPTT
jgi:membrane carboxypeptidase/penicillin-binding protein